MSFSTLVVRGRRVAEIAEEYDIQIYMRALPRDIRDDLIAAQQAQIETMLNVILDQALALNKQLAPVLTEETLPGTLQDLAERIVRVIEIRALACWERLVNRIKPRWL